MTDAQKADLVARDPRYGPLFGIKPKPAEPARERPCIHLGKIREPRTAACWKLADHDCDRGMPTATPGVICQTCRLYRAEEDGPDDAGEQTSRFLVPGLRDPMPTDEGDLMPGKESHLECLQRLLTAEIPGPISPIAAGVVICGGGKYWPGIVIAVRMLRDSGSDLPVQVWYRGGHESVAQGDVTGSNVELIDAEELARKTGDARILRGWEIKHYAITHCPFETVIYLDADAYPVADPAPLIPLARKHGFLFWHDLPHCEENVRWPEVWPAGKNGVRTMQGGQLVIHRPAVWREIVAAHWMNQHSDFYYQRMFGDQDTWRVAFAASGAKSLLCLGEAIWRDVAFVCGHEGRDYFVHRCQGKLFRPSDIPHGNQSFSAARYWLPKEQQVFDHLAELLNREADAESVFGEIYSRNLWGGGSGTGSEPAEAAPYADLINSLATVGGWTSAVDAGCGDGRVSDMLRISDYTGVDVAGVVLEANRHSRPNKSWIAADFFRHPESLPAGDVLLVKDVLHHWPSAWIQSWLGRINRNRRWKHVLLTQDVHQQADGQDCHLGGYRALHPELKPLAEFKVKLVMQYLHKAVLLLEV